MQTGSDIVWVIAGSCSTTTIKPRSTVLSLQCFTVHRKLTSDIFEAKVSDYWWIIVSTACLIMYGNMRLLCRWLEALQRMQSSQSFETNYTINNEIQQLRKMTEVYTIRRRWLRVDLMGIKFWPATRRHVAGGISFDAAKLVSCLFLCLFVSYTRTASRLLVDYNGGKLFLQNIRQQTQHYTVSQHKIIKPKSLLPWKPEI
jgi:hypothetical protein